MTDIFSEMMEALRTDEALVVYRVSDKEWVINLVKRQYTTPEHIDNILTEKYPKSSSEWKKLVYTDGYFFIHELLDEMSYERKIQFFEEEGIEWERHESKQVDIRKATDAYLAKNNIQRYKEEYKTSENRDKVTL